MAGGNPEPVNNSLEQIPLLRGYREKRGQETVWFLELAGNASRDKKKTRIISVISSSPSETMRS